MTDVLTLDSAIQAHLPPGARVRHLVPEDAEPVARIAAALGQCGDTACWQQRLDAFGRDWALSLGVDVDDRLVAYMVGHIDRGQFGVVDETAWLEQLGVDPAWQGRGLARALAEVLFDQLTLRGVARVVTMVSAHDDMLRPFFRSMGFRPSQFVCLERRL
jgi:GNAT superfamily N-acetyltransferase